MTEWQTTYPTLQTVNESHLQTVEIWCERLPKPQTDVERTIHRRLQKRRAELLASDVRKASPEIADKLNEIYARFEAMGIGRHPAKY